MNSGGLAVHRLRHESERRGCRGESGEEGARFPKNPNDTFGMCHLCDCEISSERGLSTFEKAFSCCRRPDDHRQNGRALNESKKTTAEKSSKNKWARSARSSVTHAAIHRMHDLFRFVSIYDFRNRNYVMPEICPGLDTTHEKTAEPVALTNNAPIDMSGPSYMFR